MRLMSFFQPKWKAVKVTFNDKEYMKAKGQLLNCDIEHKTKIIRSSGLSKYERNELKSYEIEVRIADVHKAYVAMKKT